MTTPPIYATFKLYVGATFSEPLGVKNPDGTPVDLTDWTARLTISNEDDDPNADPPVFELTTPAVDGLGIDIDGPNGLVTLQIDAATTLDLPRDTRDPLLLPYRLTLTNPSPTPDYVERLAMGVIVVIP